MTIKNFKQYIKDNTITNIKGCWIWQKGFYEVGYGMATSDINKHQEGAHRVSYRQFNGIILPNMLVLHSCDVRACCNPAHLRLGTYQDNSNDMKIRKRHKVNGKQISATKHKVNGWVVTPLGKFKTFRLAAKSDVICHATIRLRIKNKNFPNYYREKV